MSGRRRLVALFWLACLLSGALCLAAGRQQQTGSGQVVTLHHQQTIVTLHLTGVGELIRCDTIEVNYAEDERRTVAALRRERPVTPVSLSRLLDTLRRCQRLDTVRRRRHPDDETQTAALTETRPKSDSSTLLRGLVPGTKWCGLGDSAKGWNDLGANDELDRCCRTHDLCPVKVKAYKRRYDLFNWGLYTKSHCACDQEFYRCLKASSAREAEHVGRLFFDILQPQCVQGRVCEPNEPADTCLERQKSEGVTHTGLRFFDQTLRYDQTPRTVSAGSAGGEDGRQTAGGHGGHGGRGGHGGLSEEEGSSAEEVVHVAGAGSPSVPTKSPSSARGGGLSAFFKGLAGILG